MPPSRLIVFDWRSIKRWCLLGTFVMFAWLMLPVAKCSFAAFRDTPLPEAQPHSDTSSPAEPGAEPAEEPGFFSKLGTSMKVCYNRTPLFGQEEWKHYLLVTFAGLAVLAGTLAWWEAGKKRSYED